MRVGLGMIALACVSLFSALAAAQTAPDAEAPRVALNVPSGAPLRLYLTKRVPKRAGAPVEAKLLEPIFAFDREVIPAGTVVQGEISRTQPIGKRQRVRAIISGDFTPLRSAHVEFTTLILPDGRKLPTHTVETMALNSIYTGPKAPPQNQNGGILGTVRQTAKDRVASALDSVRGPNKKEKFIDFLWRNCHIARSMCGAARGSMRRSVSRSSSASRRSSRRISPNWVRSRCRIA